MSDERVLREQRDGVLLLTLNRPQKKNAFDDAAWHAFASALDDARADADVAVVVVVGGGDDLSAGVDLSSFRGPLAGAPPPEDRSGARPAGAAAAVGTSPFGRCLDAVVAFDKQLLAAPRGVGVGFGATFLFHCDLVYGGESLRLRLPFVSLGLVPEAASSYLLPAAIGAQRAAELFYTAEWIDAQRALEAGIVARVFPDDAVVGATLAKAREIARHPVGALQATKRCLKAVQAPAIHLARAAEDAGMAAQAGSPENIEAVMAFFEKRPPDFRRARRN